MDRARANGMVGNNHVQNMIFEKKQKQHRDRLKRIKERKPGSSPLTLDNSPPVVIEALKSDPRKQSQKQYGYVVTERENKVMLQRISTILTAKPKITDKDYQEMKKLVVSKFGGAKEKYEQGLLVKRTNKFYEQLKSLKPYYKVDDWKKDYERAQFNKKFMREVKYERPPGFVDKFKEGLVGDFVVPKINPLEEKRKPSIYDNRLPPMSSKNKKEGFNNEQSGIAEGKSLDAATLEIINNGMRNNKLHKKSKKRENEEKMKSSTTGDIVTDLKPVGKDKKKGHSASSSTINHGDDSIYSDSGESEAENMPAKKDKKLNKGGHHGSLGVGEAGMLSYDDSEVRLSLAGEQRTIRVSEDLPESFYDGSIEGSERPPSRGFGSRSSIYTRNADIQCFLINQEHVVLSAVVLELEVNNKLLDAEAEISLADLAYLKGLPDSNALLQQMDSLKQIAADMVSHVELKVSPDGSAPPRLVLNLMSAAETGFTPIEQPPAVTPKTFVPISDQPFESTILSSLPSQVFPVKSLVTEEEIAPMLLDDNEGVVLKRGRKLPVSFNVGSMNPGSIMGIVALAKKAKQVEHIYALISIQATYDDMVQATAFFLSNSKQRYKKTKFAAVISGTTAKCKIPLPSVIQADFELLKPFTENLVENLAVEHDVRSGKNVLIVTEGNS